MKFLNNQYLCSMSITAKLYTLVSLPSIKKLEESRKDPQKFQDLIFCKQMKSGEETLFGREHGIKSTTSLKEFQSNVPLRDYDALEPYIERLRKGEDYILWNQKVKWFAKSSGTSSSKSKYIPVTHDSLYNCHFKGIRKMLATYIYQNPGTSLLDRKALTLGGSVTIDEIGKGRSFYGDLSAVMLSNSNFLVERRRIPERNVALISDFETKVEAICKIAAKHDVSNFSGVPSWNLILLNKIIEYHKINNILEIWPNLELFMHGGINFEPYREQYKKIIPSSSMNYRENYNASEGYFAFQDDAADPSMILTVNNGVLYEFIPMDRLEEALTGEYRNFETVSTVKVGVNYAIVITTNSGLWRYLIGDCVRFTSTYPHKIIVSGRTQLFINTFGEELMINNAERAISEVCKIHDAVIDNYTVAPIFMTIGGKGSHQWFIEFTKAPSNIQLFTKDLDRAICSHNSDYEAKRKNNATMEELKLTILKNGCFYEWLKSKNKLGGQNKVPRLSNHRIIAEELILINERLNKTNI